MFAIICEETGFIGGTLLILAFLVLVLGGIALRATSPFGRAAAFGYTLLIVIQAFSVSRLIWECSADRNYLAVLQLRRNFDSVSYRGGHDFEYFPLRCLLSAATQEETEADDLIVSEAGPAMRKDCGRSNLV